MQHLALCIEYDGTTYAGWQRQSNALTIQACVEDALTQCYGMVLPIVGSGRTDAGVHARAQVAHVGIPDTAPLIPSEKIPIALNTRLPAEIRIRAAAIVDADFHARYGAVQREYVYRISTKHSVFTRHFVWTPDLSFDESLLETALRSMEGTHDFTGISKNNPDTASYICNVSACSLEHYEDELRIRIRANRFVYGMCRAIVGAAYTVARGKTSLETLRTILESAERGSQTPLAPAHGLTLNRITYPLPIFQELDVF
jgi:tRNA pseudouridine38-40 synthase